ncbi:pyridoxamine 5'-phosphate oxidase family protein [Streptomyces sp. NPDC058045]|uniref:pyridoxamine 5'-phosphate oxidase family protein n=1 Tax=Streptomyces sp. NPDC058045 TaxID=3346311 RepID=UPI0036EF8A58
MRARLGDRIIVDDAGTGSARRDGVIVGLHREDGAPPYDVRWSDSDEVTLVFPGPDACVRPVRHRSPGGGGTRHDAGAAGRVPDPGEVGRRLAAAREGRGMGRAETARRAGVAPGYLAYLEEEPADPTLASLVRLADVLGTSVEALRGGGTDRPPGEGRALPRARLLELDEDECRELLSPHGVGRVAMTGPQGPAVIPVNYTVVDGEIAFRTAPGSVTAEAVGGEVAFEVDHLDEAMSQGWSVLAVGPAQAVTDPEEIRKLAGHAHSEPWAGGEREMWVSIRPTRLTGRRITTDDR